MNSFKEIKSEAKSLFDKAKGSHDWSHTERVYDLCMHIGKKEGADLGILKLAALLHDVARRQQDESNGKIDHAKEGARLAEEVLRKHKIPLEKVEKIIHCIATHRFRGNAIPESKEAKVLFDADKLDSIGAVGIGRSFLFAGETGAKMHNSKNIDINKTKPYSKEDTAYREFVFKLSKIKDRMLTPEGKRLAGDRHYFMEKFFKRLDKEVAGDL